MNSLIAIFALVTALVNAMELPEQSPWHTSNPYSVVALCASNNHALFKSEKIGKSTFFRSGTYPEGVSLETDIFLAEETPAPTLSQNGALIACVRKNSVFIFRFDHPHKNTEIPFKQKPTHLAWTGNRAILVATQSTFCNCILGISGEPTQYEKGDLTTPPTSDIYPVDEALFAYQKSSHEILFCPTQPNIVSVQQLFKAPIISCAYSKGIFACLDNEKIIHILNKGSMTWTKTTTSLESPSALAVRVRNGALLVAIASSTPPYAIEMIARGKDADEEFLFCENTLKVPLQKMLWKHTDNEALICVDTDNLFHSIDTSFILEEIDQS